MADPVVLCRFRLVLGMVIALVTGLMAGAIPAFNAMRLNVRHRTSEAVAWPCRLVTTLRSAVVSWRRRGCDTRNRRYRAVCVAMLALAEDSSQQSFVGLPQKAIAQAGYDWKDQAVQATTWRVEEMRRWRPRGRSW